MNAKLVVFGLVSVLALSSCASSTGEAESESTQSTQELAWGHVVQACKINENYIWFFGTEAALNEMKKAAKLDPTYFEYIEAHLFVTSQAKAGLDPSDEFWLQGSKIDALCLTANEG